MSEVVEYILCDVQVILELHVPCKQRSSVRIIVCEDHRAQPRVEPWARGHAKFHGFIAALG